MLLFEHKKDLPSCKVQSNRITFSRTTTNGLFGLQHGFPGSYEVTIAFVSSCFCKTVHSSLGKLTTVLWLITWFLLL